MFAYYKIEVKEHVEKVAALLFKEKIPVKNVKAVEDKDDRPKTLITIAEKDCKKTFAIFKKMCYNYKVVGNRSINTLFNYVIKRSGLVFGGIIVALVVTLCSQLIFFIDISGNEKIDKALISKRLSEHGLSQFSLKKNFNEENVRNALKEETDILELSVKKTGSRVTINIIEKTVTEKPSYSKEDLVAKFDCIVTKIVVISGEPLVKIGQLARRGSKIIGAYQLNSEGVKEPVLACGSVFGNTVFNKKITMPKVQKRIVRTGKTYTKVGLKFLGYSFLNGGQHNFESYCSEVKKEETFFGNIAPLTFCSEKFFETKEVSENVDIASKAEEELNKFNAFLIKKEKLSNVKKSSKITEEKGLYFVDLFVEAEIKIS